MRKLLALILALMLPCAALCEAVKTEITLTVNEERYADILMPAVMDVFGVDEAQSAQLSMVAAELINGVGVRVIMQEDAASFDLLVSGKKLIDATIYLTEDDMVVVTSDLMRGYGLVIPMVDDQEAAAAFENVDWESLLFGMFTAGMENMARIRHTPAQGSFAGDAYQDGAYCDTYTLDDSDISAILRSIMTDDFRETVKSVAACMQIDGEALLAEMDAVHERVAAQNAYAYILRVVRNADEVPVGLSLTVMQGEAQLATLSVGLKENTLRVVFGSGDAVENHWYDHVITFGENQMSGEAVTFSAPKEAAFSYASAMVQELKSLTSWSAEVECNEDTLSWVYEDESHSAGEEAIVNVRCTGEMKNGLLNGFLQVMTEGEAYETLTVGMQEAESIAPMQDGLKLCDVLGADEDQLALLYEIADLAEQMLTMRVMLILPMDVLTNMPLLME